MKLFDLHCDTITECSTGNKKLYDNNLHVSIKKADYLEKWFQIYAIWMPDEFRGEDAINYFNKIYKTFSAEKNQNINKILHIKNNKDFLDIRQKQCSGILSIEGGSALGGKLEQLDRYYELGVRLMTLTWNGKNEIADGCYGDNNAGLTSFGREVVKRMNELNMIIDVSHLNEKGFYQVAELSEKPFIASHSDCFKIHNHPRNLKDEQLKVIIENKSLVGINFYNEFLGNRYDCLDGTYRHISHILKLGGENSISIGADFDGCVVDEVLAGVDKMQNLYEYLLSRNMNEKTINKIFYENAYLFFNNLVFTN